MRMLTVSHRTAPGLILLIVLATSIALILGACGGDDADPAATVEGYIAAYNAREIEGVMTFFTENSVVTGHPFAAASTGLDQIRAVQQEDINSSADENAYTISNVEVSGDTVTWDHVWVSDEGSEFCKFGHEAVVADGKFVTWTWPGGGFDCP